MDEINHSEEVWKDVVGWEGFYRISNQGQVSRRSDCMNPKKLRTPSKCRKGYLRAKLCRSEGYKLCAVHRLVAEAFICPSPFEGAEVNHRDGNKENNFVENLEWVSGKENMKHARGLSSWNNKGKKGEDNVRSKLNEIQVRDIRARHASGEPYRILIQEFQCTKNTIWHITSGRTWTHISAPPEVESPKGCCLP